MFIDNIALEMLHFFAYSIHRINNTVIKQAFVIGYCRLLISGHFREESPQYISNMILMFFNSATDLCIVQTLSTFFEQLTTNSTHDHYIAHALVPALIVITEARKQNTLSQIKLQTVFEFVMECTKRSGQHIHDKIAISILNKMTSINNYQLLEFLSQQLLMLKTTDELQLQDGIFENVFTSLNRRIHKKIKSNLETFKKNIAAMGIKVRKTATFLCLKIDYLIFSSIATKANAE